MCILGWSANPRSRPLLCSLDSFKRDKVIATHTKVADLSKLPDLAEPRLEAVYSIYVTSGEICEYLLAQHGPEPELNTYEFADVLKAMAQLQPAAAGAVASILRLSAMRQTKCYEPKSGSWVAAPRPSAFAVNDFQLLRRSPSG